jgi:glycosyltransferase involved in cell wall biosynthesis
MNKIITKYIHRQKLSLHPAMAAALKNGMFVIIPAYLENDTLPLMVDSLYKADREGIDVNIVIVVNDSESDSDEAHLKSLRLIDWCRQRGEELNDAHWQIITIDALRLNPKEKGAGLARKTGMDQVAIFCYLHNIDDAVMVSLDADTWVEANYFKAIKQYFEDDNRLACSIHFEHRIDESLPAACADAIELYELHLRYYKQALCVAGFPYSYHTFGSAIAFRLSAYVRAGGMTRKQAGEDFYFIHKLVYLGGYGELRTTTVYPSSRPSVRVIFGTGATVQKWLDDKMDIYETYNIQSFIDLKVLFGMAEQFFQLDEEQYQKKILELSGCVRSFLTEQDFYKDLKAISTHCANAGSFRKRFFEVFNAFRIIRYLNFVHEHFLEKMDVAEVAPLLLEANELLENPLVNTSELLKIYREIDRNGVKLTLLK